MSVLVNLSIFPVDKGESLSRYVSKVISIIDKSGLPYKLGPMGTSIEGSWDEVMNLVTKCFNAMKKESSRVYMTMTVDYRKGRNNRIKGKIASIKDALGEKICT